MDSFMCNNEAEGSSNWQVRDDLFHDPAYNTKLFEILYILEVIYNKTQDPLCEDCLDELSEVVIDTCRAWLDDDDNTDYPLNPRAVIKSVFADYSDLDDIHLKIITSLNNHPVAVHSAGFQRFVVEPDWTREAVLNFVVHVPAKGNSPKALARQEEWAFKMWYLLNGTYDTDELLYNRDIVEFGTDLSQFLVWLSQHRPSGRVCCRYFWPCPSSSFPPSQAAAEEREELLEFILTQMEDEVQGIFRSALQSYDFPHWLTGEKNQLVILREVSQMHSVHVELAKLREQVLQSAHTDTENDMCDWQEDMLMRENKRLPLLPIGSEDALRGYEAGRMGRLMDRALDDLMFGSLFGPVERDGEEGEGDVEMTDVSAGDENQHTCEAEEAPEDLGRYWE